MKWFKTGLLLFFLYSCRHFDKDYYEKITNIKFPDRYKVVACADNGEFMTITILDLDKSICRKFINDNNFLPVDTVYPAELMGLNLLDSALKKIPPSKQLLRRQVEKVPGKVGWTYIIDTLTARLYCEIDYPDFGGN